MNKNKKQKKEIKQLIKKEKKERKERLIKEIKDEKKMNDLKEKYFNFTYNWDKTFNDFIKEEERYENNGQAASEEGRY